MPLVTKNFADIITFTRASTGTYFDSAGVLQSAAVDQPRFDYNPDTLAAQGFLIEEARTNIALYSAKLDQFSSPLVWTLTGAGATLTATTDIAAPDGTMTAWTLTSSGASAQIQQSTTVVASTTYTGSFWIRRRSGTGTVNIRVVENVNTPLTGVTSQWQRFTFTTTSTTTTGRLGVFLSGLADEVDIWGAQLEAGAFPTSYIPTTVAQVTRNADVASVNTLSPWFNATEGTLYGEITDAAITVSGVSRRIANINDGTEADRITVGWAGATSVGAAFVTDNSVTQASFTSPSGAYPFPTKVALAYKAADFQAAVNGSAFATVSSGTVPTVNRMTIGDVVTGSNGTQNINGHIRRITYYPRRLSQAELTAITA